MVREISSKKFKNLILKYLKNDDIHSLNILIEQNIQKVFTPLLSLSYSNDKDIINKILDAFSYASELQSKVDKETLRKFIRRLIWMLTEESGGIPWLAPAILGSVISSDKVLAEEYFKILLSYINENEDEPENYLEHTPLRSNVYLGILTVLKKYPHLLNGNEKIFAKRKKLETDQTILNYLEEIEKISTK